MVKEGRKAWKQSYFEKMNKHLQKYDKCFIVGVDNVRSKQMQQIRIALRGKAEVVMGKNTMIRRAISDSLSVAPMWEKVLPLIKLNVGFVFTRGDLLEIRDVVAANVVEAPAKAGAIAPCDVTLPKQNTGLGPEKTSFFQALSIPTKITRGTIEILNDVPLIKKDDKVGASEATLLNMLKIYPFTYGLQLSTVFDQGSVYDSYILDITPEDVIAKFMDGVAKVAAASIAIDVPTAASVPHILANAFKDMLALSVATDYVFEESRQIVDMVKNPEKFAAAAPVAAAAAPAADKAETKAAPEAEDSDGSGSDMGMGLFD